MMATSEMSRLRLGLLLWVAGLFGVIASSILLVPQLLLELAGLDPLPAPVWVLAIASGAQGAALLAIAVWIGIRFAFDVGFHAPVFEALASGNSPMLALRPQLIPGIIGGIAGGVLLVCFVSLAPPELASAQRRLNAPLIVRILYGGITEELLLRWGVMTLLVWTAWRFLQQRVGTPNAAYIWIAIVMSALVFGLGHLPAAALLIGELSATVFVVVVIVNALFGIMAGYLFWRYGLESAIVAHILTHVLSYAVSAV